MKPSLQVRLSQHLALTPQLQQSIRLLQLSTLELHQEVEQMLEQNPFLETEDEAEPAYERSLERAVGQRRGQQPSATRPRPEARPARPLAMSRRRRVEWHAERDDWDNGTDRDDFDGIRELPSNSPSAAAADDDFDPQERNAVGPSLQEHLRAQLAGMRLSPEDHAALNVLIESLDDDGYLADTLEDIAAHLAGRRRRRREALLERLQVRTEVAAEPGAARRRRTRPARVPDAAAALAAAMRGPGRGHHHLQAAPRVAGPPRPEEADGRHRRR